MHEPELHRAIPVDQENFDNLIAGMVNGCGMEITRFSPWFDVIYDDITSILGPTLAYKKAVLRECGENPWLDSDQYILKMATERAVNLVKVASIATEELGGFFREDTDVGGSKKALLRGQISRLSSDTHNGGFSPLHLNNGTEQVVVKFSDPK